MAAYVAVRSLSLRGAFLFPRRTAGSPLTAAGLRCFYATDTPFQESTEEYHFVQRLIPPSRVPSPPKHLGPTPSGWTPPAESPPDLPYMIRRSRMHNVPVYTDVTHGNRHMTLVRKVEGDIWALERDTKEYLKKLTGRDMATQVNEVTMTLRVKGYFDKELKEWLVSKGF
ncbi:large ribosomal subunit protein mL49 [Stigmatopora nigra]